MLRRLKERNIDYVVLERGYIGDREKWTSCGFNGLNGHADFCNENSDNKRLHHVQKYMKPKKEGGDYIVIMGQVTDDSSVKHIGFNNWLDKTYQTIERSGYGDVCYRPHPLEKEPFVPDGLKIIKGNLDQVIHNAGCVITLNSNTGVDSVLAGVTCISHDKGSMIWKLREDSLAPDHPFVYEKRRKQWLKNMSYTQWTIEEMASGETWEHLKQRYEK